MKKIVSILLSSLVVITTLGVWWAVSEGPLRNPEDTIKDFYEAHERAEDQLIDPLILNGPRVVPLVLQDLPDKDMPLRRYAIGFLGNGKYEEALPILEQILSDDSEKFYFRADALIAIFSISPDRARELAPGHKNGEDLLGKYAIKIIKGENPIYWTRSYWDAFQHRHG